MGWYSFPRERKRVAYLLDGHHDLNGIQAVETEVVGEVRDAGNLVIMGLSVCAVLPKAPGLARGDAEGNPRVDVASSKLTLLASET